MADNSIEIELINKGFAHIAGCDESGMGSLVGRCYTAAVIFPADIDYSLIKDIDDSKNKSPIQRKELYAKIIRYAEAWSVDYTTADEIALYNIYWARFKSIKRAIKSLNIEPDYVLMDGNGKIPQIKIQQKSIVKGDSISVSIAAASILAKVTRDEYMKKLAAQVNEEYGWERNKGYCTKKHVEAIKKYGKTKWHRNKFIRKFV